jgi:hypothetical protein
MNTTAKLIEELIRAIPEQASQSVCAEYWKRIDRLLSLYEIERMQP